MRSSWNIWGILALALITPAQARLSSVDAGLLVGRPAVLETGLSTGVGLGFSNGDLLSWGLRAGWSTATEYTSTRTISHDDFRLRLHGGLTGGIGAGQVGLRLGLGGTAVYEVATRNQGARAGLSGDELEDATWRLVPGGELEVLVVLRVWEKIGMVLSGGPALHVLEGAHFGFVGGLALAWLP